MALLVEAFCCFLPKPLLTWKTGGSLVVPSLTAVQLIISTSQGFITSGLFLISNILQNIFSHSKLVSICMNLTFNLTFSFYHHCLELFNTLWQISAQFYLIQSFCSVTNLILYLISYQLCFTLVLQKFPPSHISLVCLYKWPVSKPQTNVHNVYSYFLIHGLLSC